MIAPEADAKFKATVTEACETIDRAMAEIASLRAALRKIRALVKDDVSGRVHTFGEINDLIDAAIGGSD